MSVRDILTVFFIFCGAIVFSQNEGHPKTDVAVIAFDVWEDLEPQFSSLHEKFYKNMDSVYTQTINMLHAVLPLCNVEEKVEKMNFFHSAKFATYSEGEGAKGNLDSYKNYHDLQKDRIGEMAVANYQQYIKVTYSVYSFVPFFIHNPNVRKIRLRLRIESLTPENKKVWRMDIKVKGGFYSNGSLLMHPRTMNDLSREALARCSSGYNAKYNKAHRPKK